MIYWNVVNWAIVILVLLILGSGIKIIAQYHRAVRLRFGKYKDTLDPGLKWIIPGVDQIRRIDIRQRTIDLKPQEVLSKDSVNLKIDGVVFYTIEEAEKSMLNVENLEVQLEAKATSELKEIIGSMDMQGALTKREEIAKKLKTKINEAIKDDKTEGSQKDWGTIVKAIQINNIELPKELIRAMAKAAEAEREKTARVTKAQGEQEASQKLQDAAKIYSKFPEAMRLRELQTYQEIGAEHNSLIIVAPETRSTPFGLTALGKQMMED